MATKSTKYGIVVQIISVFTYGILLEYIIMYFLCLFFGILLLIVLFGCTFAHGCTRAYTTLYFICVLFILGVLKNILWCTFKSVFSCGCTQEYTVM
jgi:hypothetical protein